MPGFVLLDLKRFQVDIYLHLDLACEILWYSPRVSANATSPILELPGANYLTEFIDDLEPRCRDRRLALSCAGSI